VRARGPLLLVGVSVRALAASAAGSRLARSFPGGFLALDYYGDADLLSLRASRPIRVLSLERDCGRPRTIPALVRAASDQEWRACIYAGGLENRPTLLGRLEDQGAILGNGARVVAAVRDPGRFFRFLRAAGIPHPATFFGEGRLSRETGALCLWKSIRSGGGVRVRRALPGETRPRGFYRQVFLPGTPGSAAFVADGERAVLLGVTEQLAGRGVLGAEGFRYAGNIAGPCDRLLPARGLRILEDAIVRIARRFRLRGLNGIDFVLNDGIPHVLEVNPRYTASMELFERPGGRCLVDLHLDALERGGLPRGPLRMRRFLAKGILYATDRTVWRSSTALSGLDVRDRPAEGETIETGRPICTLVVRGASSSDCRHRLERAAVQVRRALAEAGWVARPPAASRLRPSAPSGAAPRRAVLSVLR
jgi:uncharacterized protein